MPRRRPPSTSHSNAAHAYEAAARLLAARELSEAQLRERLRNRLFTREAIDAALDRLRHGGVIDDQRAALVRARQELLVKHRGRGRVLRQLQAFGIERAVAEQAIEQVLRNTSERSLLERALARKLRGPGERIEDAAHFRRLYASLLRQGFPSADIIALLKTRLKTVRMPDEDW